MFFNRTKMRVCYCQMDDYSDSEENIDWDEEAQWLECEFEWAEYQREQQEMNDILMNEEFELQQQTREKEDQEEILRNEEIAASIQ